MKKKGESQESGERKNIFATDSESSILKQLIFVGSELVYQLV